MLSNASNAQDAPPNLQAVRARVVQALLDARTPAGRWEGELSSSALSTATAVFALSLFQRSASVSSNPAVSSLISAGVGWLMENQNADGGWGDTTRSFSNISTTALCWAALSVAGNEAAAAIRAAESWLARAAGSLSPQDLAAAITARYGKDRTFSVPILTMCALAGRLGDAAWGLIPQLPFELAALPQSLFRFLRLPVVSYALPALIAIGLVRHRNRPTRNPLARVVRRAATARALRTLSAVQPTNGGFLEATPLTSFVTMSLIGAGLADHPVVQLGVRFLIASARPDGSWPIDTNLATWVTTLAVNALIGRGLSSADRDTLRTWLLAQQYRERHPYTGAAPGGWAWTNLPGAVPDADDTAGALIALKNLDDGEDRTKAAARAGVQWLLDLQNADGGMPTFCRGWTNLPFDRSGPDLTAHALLAWNAWAAEMPAAITQRVARATAAALHYLAHTQRPDGSWLPLWFGNQHSPGDENPTYGSARVLIALCEIAKNEPDSSTLQMIGKGLRHLLSSQSAHGGWGGSRGTPSTIEETSLALKALKTAVRNELYRSNTIQGAVTRSDYWLADHMSSSLEGNQPTPIGFYFAKLWYFERLYPVIFAVAALNDG